jgi:fluoroacetyl-CoA thioesterase
MNSFDGVKPGLKAERDAVVDEKLSITFTKEPVLSTPMMISLMESVCKDLVQDLLPEGYITVGYEVHVRHKAAAPLGTNLKVGCEIIEVDGRKILFDVRVAAGSTVIGEGRHRRTIIPYE